MASETRTSSRVKRTATSVNLKAQGVAKVLRKVANDTVKQHTFSSPKVDWLTIYNAGDADIKFNFNDQDSTLTTNYRTLKPGVETRKIGITKDMTFEFSRVAGSANNRIELTLWG